MAKHQQQPLARQITISGGLIHASNETLKVKLKESGVEALKKEIFEAADALLYKAKEGGRNRTFAEEFYAVHPSLMKDEKTA